MALGPHRVRAATQYAARLSAEGASVQLVVGAFPQWDGVEIPAGVTVHRFGPGGSARSLRQAGRLVSGRDGLAREADLLVAGDPHALPVARAAMRRHRGLTVRAEPTGQGRDVSSADLAVVTPWYPSPNNPLAGAFVAAATAAVSPHAGRVSVLHTEDCSYPAESFVGDVVGLAAARMSGRLGHIVEDRPEGEVARVLVPVADRLDYTAQALARLDQLRGILPTGRIEAPLVHGHTGIYGGVLATRLARPDARVVVTEHASFLPAVLRQPSARQLYDEMLDRAETLICVSGYLYDQVAAGFPQHVRKLRVIPNFVDFDRFQPRSSPPADLLRWLYVGRLLELKQVHVLLEAFARVASWEPRVSLTFVGSGPLAESLRDRARDLGLADRVTILPTVPPEEVGGIMHRHDLLVHPSRLETFGMTVVEAIASGTPVLAARSPGPAETMAGIESYAGQLVDVSTDPDVIVTGYRRLRARLHQLDLPAARDVLGSRYRRDTVVAQLLEVYSGGPAGSPVAPRPAAGGTATPPPPAPAADRPGDLSPGPVAGAQRVILIVLDRHSYGTVSDFTGYLVEQGLAVDFVTTTGRAWQGLRHDGCVRFHTLDEAERRLLVPRIERLLVFRIPGKALHVGRRLTSRWGPVWPELTVASLQTAHSRIARAFHNRLFDRVYRVFRPRILWRLARREVLPRVDLSRTRCVVVVGATGVTIGARLARLRPEMPVTNAMDRAVVSDAAQPTGSG